MNKRIGRVFIHGIFSGIIEQKEDLFIFTYDPDYLRSKNPKPVSLTLPIQDKPFSSKILFPFFDGLIPEGWLLDIVVKNWKLNPQDRMGLLLEACQDCIGAVHVEK